MNRLAVDAESLAVHRRINQTTTHYPDTASVKDLFEARVELQPDAIAVSHQGRLVSYRELNRRANGLATVLLRAGVQAGDVVGVQAHRSPELVIALVAIVKCGAVYLPFDANWPDERLDTMFTLTRCAVLVAEQPAGLAPRFPRRRVLPLDRGATCVGTNPATRVGPDDLAYINFTSGSTGVPKGVPIPHRGITRLVFAARYAAIGEHSTLLQLAPVSFDAATFELWGALLHGGTTVLYPSAFVRLSELRKVIRQHGVSTVFLTTALFNTIVDEDITVLSTVDTVLTGGEAHSLSHMRRALEFHGPDKIVSVYGPTECTTFATYYPVREIRPDEPALPIGRPIQNTRCYLVHDGALCRPGQTGELFLAGPGLSPGYCGQPDQTRERFGDWEIDGRVERLYATGDLAYFRDDDELVFQGRNDDQVKINGHRVELGEVRHQLDLYPQARQSYVLVNETATGEKVMVAFVVARTPDCTPAAVQTYLRQRLPAYMVPGTVRIIGALPLSANGKVDRRALLPLVSTTGSLS